MTRIDFYILASEDPQQRPLLACRLSEKAYRLGHRVYICTETSSESRVMDDLLWTFRAGSFVPHTINGNTDPKQPAPVLVGHEGEPQHTPDVLINLCQEVPVDFTRFARVIEFVDPDETSRQAGRRRYRLYQENDCTLTTHQLDRPQQHA